MIPDVSDPHDIMRAVDERELKQDALRNRMRADYKLFQLAEYNNPELKRNVTSNKPRTLAKKLMGFLTAAELHVSTPNHSEPIHEQMVDEELENFIRGCLNSADERLRNMLQKSIKEQLAAFTTLRGHYGGRCLIRNKDEVGITVDPQGILIPTGRESFIDIAPFDPLHTTYEIGDGLEWVCHKVRKTAEQIEGEWGVTVNVPTGSVDDSMAGIYVYDFYNKDVNTVVTAEGGSITVLKEPEDHGSPRVPCWIGAVGPVPLLKDQGIDDVAADYGESVFAENREMYKTHNEDLSLRMTLQGKLVNLPYVFYSKTGEKQVEEDPLEEGAGQAAEVGEKIELLPIADITRSAAELESIVRQEMQQGGLPVTEQGELPGAVSGYAISLLSAHTETSLLPLIAAMEDAYTKIALLLKDQFATGRYDPITLSGYGRNRKYFNAQFRPEMIAQSCSPEISVVARLPRDDQGKMALAQMARQPDANGTPLIDDDFIREKFLELKDAREVSDSVSRQIGSRMLPETALYDTMMASARDGDEQQAQLILAELQFQYKKKELETLQLEIQLMMMMAGMGMPTGGSSNGNGNGNGNGGGGQNPSKQRFDPRVLPNAALGINSGVENGSTIGPFQPSQQNRSGQSDNLSVQDRLDLLRNGA